jgi:3-keto-5-aminohexanoate cleavage enzyme
VSDSHIDFAERRVMISSAPNGARRTRSDHPSIPLTAEQLAAEARQLIEQQVSVLHLHVRDRKDRHSLDPDIYRQAISAIRKAVGDKLIIQVTSESVGIYNRHEQMDMIRTLRPEAASMALRELCPEPSMESEVGRFYEFLLRENIWPQHILYTAAEVERFDSMRKRGVFGEEHPSCLLVLGNYAGEIEGSVEELADMHTMASFDGFPWSICCFGQSELQCMLAATGQGGHVRIGFENNLWLADGSIAQSNAALLEQYRHAISTQLRVPASAQEVREQFLTKF